MLKKESFNSILVYKSQGDNTRIGPKMFDAIDIKKNIFALGFQTESQLEMFNKQSHKIICIDSTYKTNQYMFSLINLVVADEFGKAIQLLT